MTRFTVDLAIERVVGKTGAANQSDKRISSPSSQPALVW
jgi:hypothetical protein